MLDFEQPQHSKRPIAWKDGSAVRNIAENSHLKPSELHWISRSLRNGFYHGFNEALGEGGRNSPSTIDHTW